MGPRKSNGKRGTPVPLAAFANPATSPRNFDHFADEATGEVPDECSQSFRNFGSRYSCAAIDTSRFAQFRTEPIVACPAATAATRDAAPAVTADALVAPFVAFVGNLNHGITEDAIRGAFPAMDIKAIVVVRNRSTFAFVEFAEPETLIASLDFDGFDLCARAMKVRVATASQQQHMADVVAAGGDLPAARDLAVSHSPPSSRPSTPPPGRGGGRGGNRGRGRGRGAANIVN